MKKTILKLLITSSLALVANCYADNKVAYPDDYRSWTHIKSMTLHKGHPLENPFLGIHHVYGNKKAVTGSKTGTFDDGAVLVFDLLQYDTKDKASTEGERVLVGVMSKDSAKYKSTGGWGFEGFKGNSKNERLVADDGISCFDCHTSQKGHDYVFTHWRK
ncbi:MAG: cytochrome P460 family protein [Gammaproteobacteria bacterium]|nr:cytochrome P460 family protein [Gammaproteobacteria bacterium]